MIYALFAGILGFGLWRGQSYLRSVMGEALPMQDEGWMILTKRLALFFAVLAVLNEVVWRGFSTEVWVNFKTFGLTAALFLFFITQSSVFSKYGIEKAEDQD
jgi:intracellular septation protein